jgi:hypothetical protein
MNFKELFLLSSKKNIVREKNIKSKLQTPKKPVLGLPLDIYIPLCGKKKQGESKGRRWFCLCQLTTPVWR